MHHIYPSVYHLLLHDSQELVGKVTYLAVLLDEHHDCGVVNTATGWRDCKAPVASTHSLDVVAVADLFSCIFGQRDECATTHLASVDEQVGAAHTTGLVDVALEPFSNVGSNDGVMQVFLALLEWGQYH